MMVAIGLCVMFSCLAILFGVVVPLAFHQTYNAPSPIQKELDELDVAFEKLSNERAKLHATIESLRNPV